MQENFQPDASAIISEIATRIRILENKYNVSRERMFIINENLIDHYKKLNEEIRSLSDEVKEIKDSLFTIRENLRVVVKEMDFFARTEQLKVLEKYINLWNPLNFVTEQEVLDIIKKKKDGRQ